MKLKICFLLCLCLNFRVSAQEASSTTHASRIQTGDTVPDVRITGISGLRLNGKARSAVQLSELRGKLLILDFWATWCAPCRAMVPVMDSLQRVFRDHVLFLPVTYQTEAETGPVLNALQKIKPFNLPGVTGDKALHRLFPHSTLPHYVWIDEKGTLRAITEHGEVTDSHIRRMLLDPDKGLSEKTEEATSYDKTKLLLSGGADSLLRYRSVLTGFVPGLTGGMDITLPDATHGMRANVRNSPLTWLFRMAYSDHGRWFSGPRMRLLSRDSARMTTRLSGKAFSEWLKAGNGWTYELLVPPALSPNAYRMMQEDVRRLFPQYSVRVEKMRVPCLVLVRTSTTDKLKSAGGRTSVEVGAFSAELRNAPLSWWMKRMEVQFLGEGTLPLVDATGYHQPVDMKLEASMNSVDALNAALARYDLALVRRNAETDLLVVRDNEQPLQNPEP